MPFGIPIVTGPVTFVPVCVSCHVILTDMSSNDTVPVQVPLTFNDAGVGVVGVVELLEQPVAANDSNAIPQRRLKPR